MEALLLWFAIFSVVGWLAAELLEPTSSSALAPPIPEARPPRRVRRAAARSRSRSSSPALLPSPSPSAVLLSPSAAPFATSHAVVMENYTINMDRSSFSSGDDDEAHFGRMERVFEPMVGWRWRAYQAGTHEARMQQIHEKREGKRPVEVEPETHSPDEMLPPPRPSSTSVSPTPRQMPPAPRPSLPASRLLPGIPTLSELAGVQLLAAAPNCAPGFIEQFAAQCEATRFMSLRWPSLSFAEQFARKCRATQHLPLHLPLPPSGTAAAPVAASASLPVFLPAPDVAPLPAFNLASMLAALPATMPAPVVASPPVSVSASVSAPVPAALPSAPPLGPPAPPLLAVAPASPSAPPRRVVLPARSRRAAVQQTASAPAPTTSAQAPSLAPTLAPAAPPLSAPAPAPAPSLPAQAPPPAVSAPLPASASAPARQQANPAAPRPPRPSRPAAAPKVAAPRKSAFASLLDEAKKG